MSTSQKKNNPVSNSHCHEKLDHVSNKSNKYFETNKLNSSNNKGSKKQKMN